MSGSGARSVRGRIVLPRDFSAESATIIVQVEDVSMADAPANVVGEEEQRGVRLASGVEVPFTVSVPASAIDERHSYNVRAHIDPTGAAEGAVKSGDLLSEQSYPVLTRGYGDEVRITVRTI
jgi:uncharacterized lipoprotein YbaY